MNNRLSNLRIGSLLQSSGFLLVCLTFYVSQLITIVAQPARAKEETKFSGAQLASSYAADLEQLAKWCDENNLSEQAKKTRSWLPKRAPGRLTIAVPPVSSDLPPLKNVQPTDPVAANVWQFQTRFAALRRARADKLFTLAGDAIKADHLDKAYRLICQVARENPDHEQARRVLGFVKYRDGWHTPFDVEQLRQGKIWHDRFGWLRAEDVKRYEKGERRRIGHWISAAEDARRRRDIRQGWKIETEHFRVTTNHSLEQGARAAKRMEQLHWVWRATFVRYWLSSRELRTLMAGKKTKPRRPKKHRVTIFRDREQYRRAMLRIQPGLSKTIGFYVQARREVFFFLGPGQDPSTVPHEATHQLFKESRATTKHPGLKNNFWLAEGVACYMESLAWHDGYATLGGLDAGRVPAARVRLLEDGFYVPLSELASLGRDEIQSHPRIATLYSQSAGLVSFLMHYQNGRYRQSLFDGLAAVYDGKAQPSTLSDLTNTEYSQLDRQYRSYLQGK